MGIALCSLTTVEPISTTTIITVAKISSFVKRISSIFLSANAVLLELIILLLSKLFTRHRSRKVENRGNVRDRGRDNVANV